MFSPEVKFHRKTRQLISALLLVSVTFHSFARGGHAYSGHHHYSHSNNYGSTATHDHVTRGYYRKDGTYVDSYHSTNPNDTQKDNYSSKGNTNPYTGKAGTIEPDH